MYVTSNDFFLICRQGLRSNGIMVVKENVTSSDVVEVDSDDSSVTRPRTDLLKAFEKAGFRCLKEERQYHMPDGLYPIYMFALQSNNNAS